MAPLPSWRGGLLLLFCSSIFAGTGFLSGRPFSARSYDAAPPWVFSTEKREGGFSFGCRPCGTHHPSRTAEPDARRMKFPGRPGQAPCAAVAPRYGSRPPPAWASQSGLPERTSPHRCRTPYSADLLCRSRHAAWHRGSMEPWSPPSLRQRAGCRHAVRG